MPRNPFETHRRKLPFRGALDELRLLYDDAEIAIVLDWLGVRRPPALAQTAITAQSTGENATPGPIRLLPGDTADGYSLSNAVARLALAGIEARLPQWALVTEGRVLFAREPNPRRAAAVSLLPRFLLQINWADSGPGYSWPETYHCTWLPGFARWVVTASQDSPEAHGYTDEAIGHFGPARTVREGAARVILNWWRWQVAAWGQWRWAYLFATGEIDGRTAAAWAERVWDEASGEPRRLPLRAARTAGGAR